MEKSKMKVYTKELDLYIGLVAGEYVVDTIWNTAPYFADQSLQKVVKNVKIITVAYIVNGEFDYKDYIQLDDNQYAVELCEENTKALYDYFMFNKPYAY